MEDANIDNDQNRASAQIAVHRVFDNLSLPVRCWLFVDSCRVSQNPLEGAHEIPSFCLGHTEFVSCLASVCSQDYPHGLLVLRSGDSTVISFGEDALIPTSLGYASMEQLLSMVMGISSSPSSVSTSLARLQGILSIEKEAFSTAAETVKTAMQNLLIKKQCSAEKREYRKRGRNDGKIKQR
ncbi:hypothetical protein ACH5RR_010647 [Cinchona calisaya]|uniref:Uncharacterized protein n=1 Tax=Cinchona calisaya TaxID=153742 RepID=A0ABD3AJI1_9GENT